MHLHNKTRQEKGLLDNTNAPADALDGMQIQQAINKPEMQFAALEPCSK
ncbi:hypothetical protein Q4540_05745 [Pseudoalteromonas carrageenovora]|nr:hypothetical protein [Pseudoalteromonas carrageenovora]MDO6634513.1 hypothetical protein [Pseudoalteromonas carrageenovora]MDO6647988.1 hypothetical protein [Pseudoalteromonas carrageenovora]